MLKKVIVCMCLSAVAAAQAKQSPPVKPAATPAASATASSSGLPTEDAVNSFMFQMLGYNPGATWKVAEIRPSAVPGLAEVVVVITDPQGSGTNKFLVSADGKHAVTGDIIPFGPKPFEEDRLKLVKGVNGPAKGPEKAPVMVVEFSDLQCPHCKQVAPVIEQVLAQEPEARFVFQNFPLPNHNWSEKGASYVDCVGRASNDAVWKFITQAFEQQETITEANADEKLKAIATASGGNAEEIAACAAKPETKARIEASLALGKSVHVTGTPAIFINGRMVSGGAPADVLKQLIEFQATQQDEKKESSKQ